MSVSYKKLWKLLIDRNMKKKDLCKAADVSTSSIAKMGRGKTISMDVMVRICHALECNIGDVMDVIPCSEHSNEYQTC